MLTGWYFMFVIKEQPIELPHVGELSKMQELAMMFAGSALILSLCGVPPTFMYALFSACFGIVVHSMLQRGGGGVGLSSGGSYLPVSSNENDSLMHANSAAANRGQFHENF